MATGPIGPSEASDLAVVSRVAKTLALNDSIQARLTLAGLGEREVLKRLRESMDAHETKFFADKGIVTDTKKVIAHDIRLRAVLALCKMHGLLREGGLTVNADGNVGILVGGNDAVPAAWTPQLPNSNTSANTLNGNRADSTTVTSTIEGTGKPRGGLGHDRRNVRHAAKDVPMSKRAKALRRSNGNRGLSGNITKGGGKVTKRLNKSVPAPKRKSR